MSFVIFQILFLLHIMKKLEGVGVGHYFPSPTPTPTADLYIFTTPTPPKNHPTPTPPTPTPQPWFDPSIQCYLNGKEGQYTCSHVTCKYATYQALGNC